MTESKTPSTPEKVSVSAAKTTSDKFKAETSSTKKNDSQKSSVNSSPSKLSKLAVLALLIAIAAPVGHYYWQQLQHQQLSKSLSSQISEDNSALLSNYKNQMQQALNKQQQNFVAQLHEMSSQIKNSSQEEIIELNASVRKLEQQIKQQQPSDWLLHEAEYLIRIAARTLWLEQDTSAAIGLLKDADARLAELNDPTFFSVRETVHEDIKSLELMPSLDTDDVVLALMAMNKQVSQLSLAMVDLGEDSEKETDLTLSNDINDWQTNLAKTWQRFFNNFIRVRPRTGASEALMSPVQQANLKQNLSLKIQLAIWAASERKGQIYQKSLIEIQQWLNDYFDKENNINQHFEQSLIVLKNKQVTYNYPNELGALTAIRTTLKNQQIKLSEPSKPVNKDITITPQKAVKDETKTVPVVPSQMPEQQNSDTKGANTL
jgi:uroporphyrin-3 C-methyltransferase